MKLKLPYGKGFESIEFSRPIDFLRTQTCKFKPITLQELFKHIEQSLKQLDIGKTVAIAVPDYTRPNITKLILPKMVDLLLQKNVYKIKICIGTGLHRPPVPAEISELIPETVREYRQTKIVIHEPIDRNKLKFLGYTTLQTPVWILKEYCETDTKLVLSLVEPHQFAGFSGGAKGVAIGLGGKQTIDSNHSKLLLPGSVTGKILDNPVRRDIDEIGNIVGIDLLVNVVLDETGSPLAIFCGSHPTSHRRACGLLRLLYGVKVKTLYDVVIVSAGGYPRDIDLYQSQKALPIAEAFCKPGGTIILLAECSKGYGDAEFVRTLKEAKSPESLVENFCIESFAVGPHKAYLLAKTLSRYKVVIVSSLPSNELKEMFFIPKSNLKEAVEDLPKSTKILVIPHASKYIPML